MLKADVEKAVTLLAAMRELELALEGFYEACAVAFASDAPFWRAIAAQEKKHAEILAHVTELVASDPSRYSWGRPFQPAAVRTTTAGVVANTARVASGELTRERALVLARDYERSVLEARYGDVLSTENAEYLSLVRAITLQTEQHKSSIERRVAELPR